MAPTWTAPSKKEGMLVFGLLAVVLFLFQSSSSNYYYSNNDSSDLHFYPDAGEKISSKSRPSIEQSESNGLTMNDVNVIWGSGKPIPQTAIKQHTEGFTVLDNLYSRNGTIYIVTDKPKEVPAIRLMISTGYPVFNPPEEVAKREPTLADMQIISIKDAQKLFGTNANRVEGVTFLCNDPPQFINHYYHFAAEMFFGIWRAYSAMDISIKSTGQTVLPPPRRFIFTHTTEDKWRDYAKMNQLIFHAAFPSASMEFSDDWKDRAETLKPWFFDRVVLADRAAAMRGKAFTATERYAATAFELPGSARWFEPVRTNVVEFAGLSKNAGAGTTAKPVITYITRQEWGRRMLKPADHQGLVRALKNLEKTHGYEINIVDMAKLSREEQFRLAGRTTIMMGVHGNGLTSLLWQYPTPRSAVMEFFYPGGFAEDYEWTSRALGIKHYGWWGNQYFSSPDLPPRAYPDGFQGNDIPIDGDAVAALCVHQLSLNEEADD